ncbi:MAG: DUF3833 family protein [Opitutaceae bacterium]
MSSKTFTGGLTKLLFVGTILTLTACSHLTPSDFAATRPHFDILQFYTGHTRSTGLLESRSGCPIKRVATETWGHMEAGELRMTQDVTFDDDKPERRVWRIRRLDEHNYEARSENVIGVAHGEVWGNILRLDYVLAPDAANPLTHVRMTHWMMLQPDGRTMLNAVTVRKLGVVVARITEVFHQESAAPAWP